MSSRDAFGPYKIFDFLQGKMMEPTDEDFEFATNVNRLATDLADKIDRGIDTAELDRDLLELCKENIYPDVYRDFVKGKQLIRARKNRPDDFYPFVGRDIGLSPNTSQNRWNAAGEPMIYLCRSKDYHTAFKEICATENCPVTLGSFEIKKDLKLFYLIKELGILSSTNGKYRYFNQRELSWIFSLLKSSYFLKVTSEETSHNIYTITNHFAGIIKKLDIDGIVYTSTKDKDTECVALFGEEKLKWIYSDIYRSTGNGEFEDLCRRVSVDDDWKQYLRK